MKKLSTSAFIIFFFFFGIASSVHAQNKIDPKNALQHYLNNGDTTFHWVLKDSFSIKNVKGYDLLLISQKWHQYVWKHQLTILSPKENDFDGALLFINGGHNDQKTLQPHWDNPDDELIQSMGRIAAKNKATVAILNQVPNEPLFDSLVEDQIISYTLHRYQKDTSNYTWPLLFPMVKSAVRAMDALQYFAKNKLHHPIYRFVVSGASKRGWTTWLTGANDPRVAAIAPMVIDILNMPVNLAHQMNAYGSYSKQIQDYVKLGIVQGLKSQSGKTLIKMIDPYSYRKRLTMPKMIFMGTNDPYWVIDNIKNYLPEIPGINLINYTPNAGHGLDGGRVAFPTLSAFFGITMAREEYPACSWTTNENKREITLMIKASKNILQEVSVWYANSNDMDFRDEKWLERKLPIKHKATFNVTEKFPASGYRAFYVNLTYKDPNGGTYSVCTRAFMIDNRRIL